MTSDTVIDRLGWKPLSERRVEVVKELVNKVSRDMSRICFGRIDIRKRHTLLFDWRQHKFLFSIKLGLFNSPLLKPPETRQAPRLHCLRI